MPLSIFHSQLACFSGCFYLRVRSDVQRELRAEKRGSSLLMVITSLSKVKKTTEYMHLNEHLRFFAVVFLISYANKVPFLFDCLNVLYSLKWNSQMDFHCTWRMCLEGLRHCIALKLRCLTSNFCLLPP